MHLNVCLSVRLSICVSKCPSVHLSESGEMPVHHSVSCVHLIVCSYVCVSKLKLSAWLAALQVCLEQLSYTVGNSKRIISKLWQAP